MKYTLILFLSILFSCSDLTQGDPVAKGEYSGKLIDGNREDIGKLIAEEGTYIGEFKNNRVNGYGEFKGNDGRYYKGCWFNRQWHGVGETKWQDGSFCVGEFKHDKMHGFVAYTRYTGGTYLGYYENGIKTGVGKITFVSPEKKGDIYIGEVKNDEITGHGKFFYADGSTEDGIFKNSKLIEFKRFAKEDSIRIINQINNEYERVKNELKKKEENFKHDLIYNSKVNINH